MFVDASALCAVLLREPGYARFERALVEAHEALVSPMSVWETVRAVARVRKVSIATARADVAEYIDGLHAGSVAIGEEEREAALDALERFGKGQHPAKLNMGDCFAYACARTHDLPLLFTGKDFSQTDIQSAV